MYAVPFNTISIKILVKTNGFVDEKSEVKNSTRLVAKCNSGS